MGAAQELSQSNATPTLCSVLDISLFFSVTDSLDECSLVPCLVCCDCSLLLWPPHVSEVPLFEVSSFPVICVNFNVATASQNGSV